MVREPSEELEVKTLHDMATNVTAAVGLFVHWWLPVLDGVSVLSAKVLPIASVLWIGYQFYKAKKKK